jgi:hypothetical protein
LLTGSWNIQTNGEQDKPDFQWTRGGPPKTVAGSGKWLFTQRIASRNRLFAPAEQVEIVPGFDVMGREANQAAQGLFCPFEIAVFLQEGVTQ